MIISFLFQAADTVLKVVVAKISTGVPTYGAFFSLTLSLITSNNISNM